MRESVPTASRTGRKVLRSGANNEPLRDERRIETPRPAAEMHTERIGNLT